MSLLSVLLKFYLVLCSFWFFLFIIYQSSKKFQLEKFTHTRNVEQECDKRGRGLCCWNAKRFSIHNKPHLLKYGYWYLISDILHWPLTHSNLLPLFWLPPHPHHLPFFLFFILSHPLFYVNNHKFFLNLIWSGVIRSFGTTVAWAFRGFTFYSTFIKRIFSTVTVVP